MRTKPNPRMHCCRMNSVAIEETEVLQIIRDYLEESGRAKCLVAIEAGSSGVGPPQGLPAEVSFLRELILAGRWHDLTSFMEPLAKLHGEDEEYRKCQYVLAKQQYLESLVSWGEKVSRGRLEEERDEEQHLRHSRRLQNLKVHLERVQQLCPSKEEYSNLLYLLTLPSLPADEKYRNWTVDGSRLQCFYTVGSWVGKVLYPGSELRLGFRRESAEQLTSNRLVQLLSKGLLYEECEAICSQRGESTGRPPEILDLCGWVRHQPDSAFQLTPSKLSLVLVPHVGPAKDGRTSSLAVPKNDGTSRVSPLFTSLNVAWKSPTPLQPVQQARERYELLSRSVPEMAVAHRDRGEEEKTSTMRSTEQAESQDEDVPPQQKRSVWDREKQVHSSTSSESKHEESRNNTNGPQEGRLEKEEDTEGTDEGRSSGIGAIGSDPEAHQLPDFPAADIVPETLPPRLAGKVRNSSEPLNITEKPKAAPTILQGNINVPSNEEQSSRPPPPANVKPPAPALHSHLVPERLESNFGQLQAALEVMPSSTHLATPLNSQFQGHPDSSTPKPVSSRPLVPHPSFPPSPVPYVPGTHQLADTPDSERDKAGLSGPPSGLPPESTGNERRTNARKQIKFEGNVWPTATLLSTVSDQQVVRSVAFSQTGEVVAIGANSKVLRLCSTAQLLEERPRSSDELAVFYHHPRYHRGSIYCMAWLGDSLLASGSNDQTIKLLSHTPLSPSPCLPLGQLTFHNGTVRDLAFLPDGLLASGGAGDCALKIANCESKQLVSSYPGHTDQILTIAVVNETVIASGSQDKMVKLWDTRQKDCFHSLNFAHVVTALSSTSRSGLSRLALAQTDGSCTIYDLRVLKTLGTIHPHTDECRTVRFDPNGAWLLSGAYDGSMCLTAVDSLQWKEVAQRGDKVIQCRWHASGRLFASTGVDKKACFWSLQ